MCVCVSGQVFRDGHAADVEEEVWFSGEHVEERQQNRTVYSETVTIDALQSAFQLCTCIAYIYMYISNVYNYMYMYVGFNSPSGAALVAQLRLDI